jgi:hypothetical protein
MTISAMSLAKSYQTDDSTHDELLISIPGSTWIILPVSERMSEEKLQAHWKMTERRLGDEGEFSVGKPR